MHFRGLRAVITNPAMNTSRRLIQLRLGCLCWSVMLNFSLCVLKDPVSYKLGGLSMVLNLRSATAGFQSLNSCIAIIKVEVGKGCISVVLH